MITHRRKQSVPRCVFDDCYLETIVVLETIVIEVIVLKRLYKKEFLRTLFKLFCLILF